VAERNDLEIQFCAAAKPTGEPGEKLRNGRKHAGQTTAGRVKSPDFSIPSEFSVATGFDLAFFAGIPLLSQLPPLEEIAIFASEIRNGIEQLRRTTRWEIELPRNSGIVRIIEPRPRWRSGKVELVGYQSIYGSDDFRTSFLLCAADTVEAEGTRIRVCAQKDCGRVFARHRRAKYWSSRCSQKERDLRFRRRHPKSELSKRRHRYYKNRIARVRGRATADKARPRSR
jgi:hypothetical protein